MIPVKYAAGRTAFVFHNQAERTPYQYTNQITYIEKNGYHKDACFVKDIDMVQYSYS